MAAASNAARQWKLHILPRWSSASLAQWGSTLPGWKSTTTLNWPINRWNHGTDMLDSKKSRLNSLWGYIRDRVFVPPLPASLNEMKHRITTAVARVDEDMLRSVWTELDYRVDICLVTKGSNIEHLLLRHINLKHVLQNHVSILAKSLVISFQYKLKVSISFMVTQYI